MNKDGRIKTIRVRYLSASIVCFIYNLFCYLFNFSMKTTMFRLFLIIISVFMISSCSNTQPPKKKTINSLSLHEQQNMEKKSMILIMDFGDSESQIIKCCDSLLTYGVGYVETTTVPLKWTNRSLN